VLVWKNFNKLN